MPIDPSRAIYFEFLWCYIARVGAEMGWSLYQKRVLTHSNTEHAIERNISSFPVPPFRPTLSKCSPPQLSHVNVNRVYIQGIGRTGNEAMNTV